MRIINNPQDMQKFVKEQKRLGKTVGFVPTMGYLHQGHLSLVERAKRENDLVVVSIFVNPTQFGQGEDFDIYPRDFERDQKLLEGLDVDAIFYPAVEDIYPANYKTYVEVYDITEKLCGASRPGHFKGVTTIVTKLFNMVLPDRAYFGLKDAQQVLVIKQMVKDLNFPVEIVPCPIVREEDGLAMSSRNVNLNPDERKAALVLSQSLFAAQKLILEGERDGAKIKRFIEEKISKEPLAKIDYVKVVSGENLEEVEELKGEILIALAVKIGKVRLIDNIMVEV
ncbi:pantoate--beta-alanine ligase [Anaerobranca californiensis DSM 14826]|jgi:pantoate--beta-alanine ligase|uniref:Pantothenate synthetase n=1 Tax=Anaerobranca californiensis DSM 14826 TaxID=1120989 RepID=A0A1M6NZ93_9FIRM|nr:pantoate--beta-alanine ligase [Anaerobranca californiensis]SHK01013.1 pantoate--beta-alanine ligase [Anaerobranca californiensis DSM 14826]